jgi:hypothetical protein
MRAQDSEDTGGLALKDWSVPKEGTLERAKLQALQQLPCTDVFQLCPHCNNTSTGVNDRPPNTNGVIALYVFVAIVCFMALGIGTGLFNRLSADGRKRRGGLEKVPSEAPSKSKSTKPTNKKTDRASSKSLNSRPAKEHSSTSPESKAMIARGANRATSPLIPSFPPPRPAPRSSQSDSDDDLPPIRQGLVKMGVALDSDEDEEMALPAPRNTLLKKPAGSVAKLGLGSSLGSTARPPASKPVEATADSRLMDAVRRAGTGSKGAVVFGRKKTPGGGGDTQEKKALVSSATMPQPVKFGRRLTEPMVI